MPVAISLGISYWDFWKMNPHILNVLAKNRTHTLIEQDRAMHSFGYYIQSAVANAIGSCFGGHKHKNSYPKEPFFVKYYEEANMTEEELIEKQIQEMIAIEEQWIVYDKQRGLKEADIWGSDE